MTIAVVVLVVVAGVWVLRPLFGRRRATVPPADVARSELVEAKHAVYRSILDLEFDRAVGKVAPADYEALRREHEEEAVGILRALDEAPAAGDAGALDVLEREIAAARQRRRGL
ncbi:MAG: c-type cytochrome biogenesis protein CcmI [Actinomycetota bacterium]